MTSPLAKSATYAVDPSGVMATPFGALPTGIAVPAVRVATSIGVRSELPWLTT
jgi:hypothetical protein